MLSFKALAGSLTSWRSSGHLYRAVKILGTSESVRCRTTSTPLGRLREEALFRTAVPMLLRSATKNGKAPGEEHTCPASVVADACRAALDGESKKCLSLVWALKDMWQSGNRRVLTAVNKKAGDNNMTLLQVLSGTGLVEPVRQLLDMAPAVNATTDAGRSALHFAAEKNHAEIAQLLLSRGKACVNARDMHGKTALHLASALSHGRTCRVLARFGANVECASSTGETALSVAQACTDDKIAPWLQQWVAKRSKNAATVGKVSYFKGLGTKLPAHIVAPKLQLTPIGYCPVEDGEVVKLKRGIRNNKKRAAPSNGKSLVNWYVK